MENTLENKERFFMQYFGVDCLKYPENQGVLKMYSLPAKTKLKKTYLELTPLSGITDRDAIEISNILDGNFNKNTLSNQTIAFHVNRGKSHVLPSRPSRSDVCDYLRSKGYTMPYVDLSVEKQIEYGWVKLKY